MSEPTETDPVTALLERTLASRAAHAPASPQLAARARATRRRRVVVRSSVAAAAAIGVAAAIAVPTILFNARDAAAPSAAARGSGASTPSAYSGLPPVAPLPDGWRWETYGGVELQVPADWKTGTGRGPWCAVDASIPAVPYVSRPIGVMPLIACAGEEPRDRWVPYVDFSSSGAVGREELGDGWVRETREVGTLSITVQADDETLLERILASARAVTDLDANGCPVNYSVTRSLDARPTTGALDPGQVGPDGVVCQYGLDLGLGGGVAPLVASYRLTADEVRSVVDAVAAAPVGGGPDSPADCMSDYRRGDSALVVRVATTDGARDVVVWYAGCVNGADDGVTLYGLTADILSPLFHGAVQATSYSMLVGPLMPPPAS